MRGIHVAESGNGTAPAADLETLRAHWRQSLDCTAPPLKFSPEEIEALIADLPAGAPPTAAEIDDLALQIARHHRIIQERLVWVASQHFHMLEHVWRSAVADAARALRARVEEERQQASDPGLELFGKTTTDRDWLAATPPPIDWVLPGVLPIGELGILAGADGSGKSYLAMLAAVSVAYGLPWAGGILPAPATTGDVLILAGEDDTEELTRRAHAIWTTFVDHGTCPPPAEGRIRAVTLGAQTRYLMIAGRQERAPEQTAYATRLEGEVAESKPRLLILDPLIMFHSVNENDSQHMDALARLLIRIARAAPGCAALVVHHAGQDSVRGGADDHYLGRGSGALNAAARAVVTVRRLTVTETRDLHKMVPSLRDNPERVSRLRIVRGPKVSRSGELPGHLVEFNKWGVPWSADQAVADAVFGTDTGDGEVRSDGRKRREEDG